MAINLWYDYIFGIEICNNLLDSDNRREIHNNKKVLTHTIKANAVLPNLLKIFDVDFKILPAASINYLRTYNWNETQFFPVEIGWWHEKSITYNFEESHFLKWGKPNVEFLIWFPQESILNPDTGKYLVDPIHDKFPNRKIRFVHGNLTTPKWAIDRPYLNFKSFDFFWHAEQQYDRVELDINKKESSTFSFYNNRHRLHRAIPYYRLLNNESLLNADTSYNGHIMSTFLENGGESLFNSIIDSDIVTKLNPDDDFMFYGKDNDFKNWFINKINPINTVTSFNDMHDLTLHSSSYLDVITETLMESPQDYNNLFITEKTYRPISRGCIFLILGHMGTLKYLKSKGIITFNDIFDESYDEVTHWFNRWKIIEKNIKIWLDLGIDGRRDYYIKNFDKLQHNQNILYSRDFKSEIESIFN